MRPDLAAALSVLKTDPASLPKEPGIFDLLPPRMVGTYDEGRMRLEARNGWSVVEEVCRGCGRIFHPVHQRRVNCDLCVRTKKVLGK